MDITPLDNSFILCEHWLSNAKNNILNKDILCLQIFYQENKEYSFKIVKNFIKNIMNESQEEILEDSKNCFATKLYTIYFNFVNQIDICYEQNRNIIFVTMSIPEFSKFDRPILCVSLKDYSLDLNSKFKNNPLNKDFLNNFFNNVNNSNLSSKTYEENSIYYKKVLPLFKLMKNKAYEKIATLTYNFVFLEPNTFIIHELLQDTEYLLNKSYFGKLILDDLEILVNEKILLHRLSIILYRLFFHQITESVSIIDKFFAQKLGFGVATNFYHDNLNFYVKNLNTYRTLKAYDLGQLEIKQLITAKEIIKNQINRYENDFDKETIHEITHLSYETIDELINNIRGYENDSNL
jgi:hypothetical protein